MPAEAARIDDWAAWQIWAHCWEVALRWDVALIRFVPIVYVVALLVTGGVLTRKLQKAAEDEKTSAVWEKLKELEPFLGKPGIQLTKNL